MVEANRREKIIRMFLLEKPYRLSYEYRKQLYRDDRPVLEKLLRDGLIEQVSVDNKRVVFRYIGPV
ncbi:MAG: hypothetical protein M1510_11600 [Nitrospirae bacterium]|nr:hypothetical protein [Nitrospirota bacterium]